MGVGCRIVRVSLCTCILRNEFNDQLPKILPRDGVNACGRFVEEQNARAGDERGGETEFTVAGTIFASATRQVGVDGAEIRMTDADGTQHTTKTNCVGNFFVKPNEWVPKFPVLVAVAKGGTRRSMQSVIGRDGSCAHCHSLNVEKSATGAAVDPKKVAQVYLFGGDEPSAPNGALDCPAPAKKPGSP